MDILPQTEPTGEQSRDLMRGKEIMRYYKIGYPKLKRWRERGAPYHVVTGDRWYSVNELNAWLKTQ